MSQNITIFEVDERHDGRRKYFVSLLPMEAITKAGSLAPEAIMGELTARPSETHPIAPESFVANSKFKELLHAVIESFASDPDLIAEAQRIRNGSVPILDLRLKDTSGGVPLEDIIGVFSIESGKVGKYHVSPKHRLLSERGFFELDPRMHARLMAELERRCVNR